MAYAPSPIQRLKLRLGPGVFAVMATILGLHLFFLLTINAGHSSAMQVLYDRWLALSLDALGEGRLWTLVTYGLLHDLRDPFHVLFNLLALYFFGPDAERRWGTGAFFRFVVVAVLAGGVLQAGGDAIRGHVGTTVGASAAMMALLAAFSWTNPDAKVLLFFVFPVECRYLVPIVVGLDLLMFLTGSDVAFFAHLGGIGAAWLMLRGWPRPKHVGAHARGWWSYLSKRAGGGKRKPFHVIDGGRKPGGDRSTWN